MANKSTYLIDVKTKGAKQSEKKIGGVNKSLKRMAKSAGLAAAAFFGGGMLLDGLKKSIELSSKFEGVNRGFTNLAKASGFSSQALQKLKNATDGTMGSMELMTQANNAMLLGIADNEEQMAEMFDTAQRLAKALGQDAAFGIESLVTGLGRQSKLMLDNLGIMIDTNKVYDEYAKKINKASSELTDQEKKAAFVEGALSSAKDMVEDLGEEQLDTRDTINQMNVAFEDLSITLGNKLSPATKASASAMTLFVRQIDDALTFFDRLEEASRAWVLMEDGETAIMNLRKELETMTKPEITARMEEIAEKSSKIGQFGDADQAQTLVTMFQMLQEALPNAFDGLSEYDIKYNEFVETQKEAVSQYQQEQEMIAFFIENHPKLAKSIGLVTDANKKSKDALEAKQKAEISAMNATAQAFGEFVGGAKIAARIQQVSATIDAYRTINKIMADPKLVFPTNVLMATAIGAQAFANVKAISGSIGEFKAAQYGMNEVVDSPTLILAGENNQAEQVNITPLEGENRAGGSAGANITFNNPIMTKDFVEGELAEAIRTASRQGVDFGV